MAGGNHLASVSPYTLAARNAATQLASDSTSLTTPRIVLTMMEAASTKIVR
jgi:hypothetical protein